MRLAIDTNCLISALVNSSGTCAWIVSAWLDGRVEAVASEATVREAELVLGGRWLARMVETAVAGGARYVATTDREFLSRRGYGEVEFVTPGELLRRLEEAPLS
jgi:predicted nucleic acid-binding protein